MGEDFTESLSEGFSDGVTVNFMCQLGSATVPENLVERYSGCFYEGIFWMQLIFIYSF